MVDMTADALAQICKDLKLYRTPALNDKLYLHYKGFRAIRNLGPYTGVRALWLEGNGLGVLEGLDTCVELRSLYAQENCIQVIENLDHNVALATLNLNKNCIDAVGPNLAPLVHLETLMLSHNRLETKDDLAGLVLCPSITTLDVQQNQIDDPAVLDILVQMPNLRALYLLGNPVTKKIKHYRKRLTYMLPELRYLDDRPVFPGDRLRAEAFMKALEESGGDIKAAQAAERTEIRRQRDEKKAKEDANFQAFEDLIRNARLKAEAERAAKLEGEQKVEGAGRAAAAAADGESKAPETDASRRSVSAAVARVAAQGGLDAPPPAPAAAAAAPPPAPAADDDVNPWAIPPKTKSQKATAKAQAAGMNPFSGEPVRDVPESAVLKQAREARLQQIMDPDAPPPPQVPAAAAAAPTLPPPIEAAAAATTAAAGEVDSDDDDYGFEPPAALMQLQSMIGEVEREKSEQAGVNQPGMGRKGGIVVQAEVDAKLREQTIKAMKKADREASHGGGGGVPTPTFTDVTELD